MESSLPIGSKLAQVYCVQSALSGSVQNKNRLSENIIHWQKEIFWAYYHEY